ncbi:MAG TPA: FG-GAP-like repeat-containing protein [Thermoanaerobaculia bacterium]|nr:FG-GAP-like repeat-containing protein [Thermoanaerobaculia bacterium]
MPLFAERLPLLRDAFVSADAKPRAGAVRSRFVEPSFDALVAPELNRGDATRVEQTISIQMFNDVWLPVALDSVERNAVDVISWRGKVEGDPSSIVTIAVKDDSMSVFVTTNGKRYDIRPTSFGVHEAAEVDAKSFPNELEPLPALRGGSSENPVVGEDAAGTWDVLVVYTAVLRAFYGGTSAMQTLATSSITASNTAYANSGVTSRLRLAGTLETSYDDTTASFGTTLSRLATQGDGYMDEVHTYRDTVGADAVSLLVLNPTDAFCGIGYLMVTPSTFASSAFNVVLYSCAVDNLSFPHELGHNFGLNHDRANAGGQASYSYAYGYQDTQQQFRDIMAYSCPQGCPRIQYFSTPDILIFGRPLGVIYTAPNSADNVRALNNNAQYIANWRQSVAPPAAPAPQDLDGDGKSDILFRNTTSGSTWMYKMNGASITSSVGIYQVPDTNWKIITAADLTGDGKSDILWRNFATGTVYLYTMNGATITASQLVHSEPDLAWKLLDTGDLNGDGKADLIWRNTSSGAVYGMLMNGAAITSSGVIHTEPSASWQIVAVGDVNGDNKDDLVWRNSSNGQVYVYLMNGLAITAMALVHTEPNQSWEIVSAADFDGDGKDDLLWRNNANGTLWVDKMNGTTVSSGYGIYASPDTNWRISGTGDYNGDGKADILWRHAVSGVIYLYLMNGSTISGSLNVYTVSDLTWKIAAPSTTTASSNGN